MIINLYSWDDIEKLDPKAEQYTKDSAIILYDDKDTIDDLLEREIHKFRSSITEDVLKRPLTITYQASKIGNLLSDSIILNDTTSYIVDCSDLSLKEAISIIQTLPNKVRTKVILKGNSKPISIKEVYHTYYGILGILKPVSKESSSLERLRTIYDGLKLRKVDLENDEDIDLTDALFSKITNSRGISKIFDAIIEELNDHYIKSTTYETYSLDTKKEHHRNIVYLKDPKSSIKGIFMVDAALEKKNVDSYDFFLKTPKEMEKIDERARRIGYFSSKRDSVDIKHYLKKHKLYTGKDATDIFDASIEKPKIYAKY